LTGFIFKIFNPNLFYLIGLIQNIIPLHRKKMIKMQNKNLLNIFEFSLFFFVLYL
jgi:hypothetical protein